MLFKGSGRQSDSPVCVCVCVLERGSEIAMKTFTRNVLRTSEEFLDALLLFAIVKVDIFQLSRGLDGRLYKPGRV